MEIAPSCVLTVALLLATPTGAHASPPSALQEPLAQFAQCIQKTPVSGEFEKLCGAVVAFTAGELPQLRACLTRPLKVAEVLKDQRRWPLIVDCKDRLVLSIHFSPSGESWAVEGISELVD